MAKRKSSKKRIYFFSGRRTGIVATSAVQARAKKRRGGDKLVSSRTLTAAEASAARSGRWIRSRPPGFRSGMRGYGPRPKR